MAEQPLFDAPGDRMVKPFTRRIASVFLGYPEARLQHETLKQLRDVSLICFRVTMLWPPPFCYVAQTASTSFLVSMREPSSISRFLALCNVPPSPDPEYMELLQQVMPDRFVITDCEQFVKEGGRPEDFQPPHLSEDGLYLYSVNREGGVLDRILIAENHQLEVARYEATWR